MIDLRSGSPPQLNIFAGLKSFEIQKMLVAGFDLYDTDSAGVNYYRNMDREAAMLSANLLSNCSSYSEFIKLASRVKDICNKDNFWKKSKQLSMLQSINSTYSLDWQSVLSGRHILYIAGDSSDTKVLMAMKMILSRLTIEFSKRDYSLAPVALFIAELRFLLNELTLNVLSTIRDKRVHLFLSFQDIANLKESKDVHPDAVESIVVNNSSIKIVYKIGHLDTAKKLSCLSGIRRVWSLSVSLYGGMIWTESERYLIAPDDMLYLPKFNYKNKIGIAYLFGFGAVKLIHSSFMREGDIPSIIARNI